MEHQRQLHRPARVCQRHASEQRNHQGRERGRGLRGFQHDGKQSAAVQI